MFCSTSIIIIHTCDQSTLAIYNCTNNITPCVKFSYTAAAYASYYCNDSIVYGVHGDGVVRLSSNAVVSKLQSFISVSSRATSIFTASEFIYASEYSFSLINTTSFTTITTSRIQQVKAASIRFSQVCGDGIYQIFESINSNLYKINFRNSTKNTLISSAPYEWDGSDENSALENIACRVSNGNVLLYNGNGMRELSSTGQTLWSAAFGQSKGSNLQALQVYFSSMNNIILAISITVSSYKYGCNQCPLGSFMNITNHTQGKCMACSIGTQSSQDFSTCDPCALGFYRNSQTMQQCQACPVGTFADSTGSIACLNCPIGTFNSKTGSTSLNACILCAKGFYNNQEKQSSCQLCPNFQYAPIGSSRCFNCSAGSQPSNDKGSCELCPPGKFSRINGTLCQACPFGEATSLLGSTSCVKCPRGTQTSINRDKCDLCNPGTFNNNTGADCIICRPGTYSTEGAFECKYCDPGKELIIVNGKTDCRFCKAGTFHNITTFTCQTCPANTKSTEGATTCESCPIGTQDTVNKDVCIKCPIGTFNDQIQSYCKTCPFGTIANETGMIKCIPCPPGTQANSTTQICEKCKLGYYNGNFSDTCKPAPPNFFTNVEGAFEPQSCDLGTHTQTRNGQKECVPCDDGTYNNEAGKGCEMCPASRKYSNYSKTDCSVIPWWSIIIMVLSALFIVSSLILIIIAIIIGRICYVRARVQNKVDDKNLLQTLLDENATEMSDMNLTCSLPMISFDEITQLEEIGIGGSGALVLRGVWQYKSVVVKLYKMEQAKLQEFENEMNLLAALRDKNIVYFYGACVKPPRVGIIMEYCSNGTLKQYFERNKNISFKLKLEILLEIASGMRYLHGMKVIHRDLKPDNILIDDHVHVKITDFGLSKQVGIAKTKQHTMHIGTAFYMAPEVTLGKEYNEKCDVFSFGIIMYSILTEKWNPYEKHNFNIEVQVAMDPNYRPKVIDSSIPDYLIALMEICWKHESKERPSFEQIYVQLQGYLQDVLV